MSQFSRKEFKTVAIEAIAAVAHVRKIRVEDELFRKLQGAITVDNRESLFEALTTLMHEFAVVSSKCRIRYDDVIDIVQREEEASEANAPQLAPEGTYQVRKILGSYRRDGVTYYFCDWEPSEAEASDIGSRVIAAFKRERRALVRHLYIDDEAVEAGK